MGEAVGWWGGHVGLVSGWVDGSRVLVVVGGVGGLVVLVLVSRLVSRLVRDGWNE